MSFGISMDVLQVYSDDTLRGTPDKKRYNLRSGPISPEYETLQKIFSSGFTTNLFHGKWSGEIVWFPLPAKVELLEREKSKYITEMTKGDIVFCPAYNEIILGYGNIKLGDVSGNILQVHKLAEFDPDSVTRVGEVAKNVIEFGRHQITVEPIEV